MSEPLDDAQPFRYRSSSGLVLAGAWAAFVLAAVLCTGFGAATRGEPPWFFVAFVALILLAGMYSMSLQMTITATGHLKFRGLLRQRQWKLAELQTIRPGTGCAVFKFQDRSAMLATSWDPDWASLLDRIRQLNPSVRVIEPPAPFGRRPGGEPTD